MAPSPGPGESELSAAEYEALERVVQQADGAGAVPFLDLSLIVKMARELLRLKRCVPAGIHERNDLIFERGHYD